MAAWRRSLGAFATSLLLLLVLPAASPVEDAAREPRLDWWQAAVVYHVNVRLFRDADGDGVGDLAGVAENLDFLAKLGVDVLWLSPIFSSASEHYVGHKISNFTDIDPAFGDMASFRKLVEKAASLGMKVLLEFVPNHTSDSHEWFQRSLEQLAPYADYYVWQDGVDMEDDDDREPPNNWLSVTGGSAWTWNEERGQFFLHQFGDTQPDLNYWNYDLRKQIEEALVFWLHRGASGFVLSSISHLYESKDLQDEPLRSTGKDWEYSHLVHNNTLDLPETYHQVYQWHKLMDEFGGDNNFTRFLVVGSHSNLKSVLGYYGSEETPIADMPLNFRFLSSLRLNNSAKEMETAIKDWLLNMPPGSTANWMVGSNIVNDMVTHFSAHMVDVLNTMLQLLPGVIIVYNGDLTGETAWDESAEYGSLAAGDEAYSTLNWDLFQPFGSATGPSENGTSLLHSDSSLADGKNINQEFEDVHSRLLKQMALRRSIPTLRFGDVQVSAVTTDVLVLIRSLDGWDTFAAFINFGEGSAVFNMSLLLNNVTSVVVHTCSSNSGLKEGEKILSPKVNLLPHASVLLRLSYIPPGSMDVPTEDSILQTELYLQEFDNTTETMLKTLENSTEIYTTDSPDNITEIPTEGYGAEPEISTQAPDKSTEIFTQMSDSYTEIYTQIPDNSTEIYTQIPDDSIEMYTQIPDNSTETSEVVNESEETYADTAGIENSTEISTAATRNVPEPDHNKSASSIRSKSQTDNLATPQDPCNACNKAQQQTEPPTTMSTTSKVGESHTPCSIFISSLTMVLVGLM